MNEKYRNDIVFVILHYNVYKETIKCINSIKENIDTKKYHIVIVDNFSSNKSGKILFDRYSNDDRVTIVLHSENCGFAIGNNIGIDYAKKHLKPEFICCLNNDTLLEQTDFFCKTTSEYKFSNTAVIGPCILLKDDSIQEIDQNLLSIKEYKKQLSDYKEYNKHRLKYFLLSFKTIRLLNTMRKRKRQRFTDRKENVILHGCCIIFTPIFFEYLEGFNPKTFLFREEELLFIDLKKHKLNSVYNPNLFIRHMEDAATDSIVANKEEKNKFIRENQIKSLKVLIEELENYYEN